MLSIINTTEPTKRVQIYGNNILPCPWKMRKLQRTRPPFFQTILPTFWRLLNIWLWVDRFVRAPCCLKTILRAENDLWTQKNSMFPLVQTAEAPLLQTRHDSTLCQYPGTSKGYFNIKIHIFLKDQNNKDLKPITLADKFT